MDFVLFLDFCEDYLVHFETTDLQTRMMRNALLDLIKDLNAECLRPLSDPLA